MGSLVESVFVRPQRRHTQTSCSGGAMIGVQGNTE